MRITQGAVLFLTLFWRCGSVTRYISHIQNYVNLVSAYNLEGYSTVDFPPLADVSQTIQVLVDIHLYAVNGFDEVAGNIELVVALEMSWLDEMSVIQSIQFRIEDRTEFLVPYDQIWTPKLVLTNAIGETSDVGDSAYLCRFDMVTKTVYWKPRVVISGSCTPDVTFYPFDKQECDFVYTAWGFKSDEILISSTKESWNLDEYGESGEWDIDSTRSKTYVQNEQSYIKFTLVMVRKPLYFAFNILLPILVLCLLNSTVFLLPAESGERVGFSVTCFLSFMVLLNMIMDIMPRSSNPISFICYYLVVMMSNSGAMTLVTILLMRVYHKPEKSEVPKWMQRAVTFVNCGCAKLRCCVICCRYIRNTCCCKDQRKCGCKRRGHSEIDESLSEISIDSHQNIIEKPVEKKILETIDDEEPTKSSKCCILSCMRSDKTSDSKCCCGCIIGCKNCKKSEKEKDLKSSTEMTQKEASSCAGFCRRGKRKNEDEAKVDTYGNNESKKQKKDENEGHGQATTGCIRSPDHREDGSNKETEKNHSCVSVGKTIDESTGDPKTVEVTCLKDGEDITPNKSGESTACFSCGRGKQMEKGKTTNRSCCDFLRKKKISSVSSLDETEIDDDKKSLSARSKDNKTLKVSFKGHDKLDTQDTILQRWENDTQTTASKKRSELTPINQINRSEDETKDGYPDEDHPGEVTLKTKSIRASAKERETTKKRVTIQTGNSDGPETDIELVRKKLTGKSIRASAKESETTKKKVTIQTDNSDGPDTDIELVREKLTGKSARENLPSQFIKDDDGIPFAQRRKSTGSLPGPKGEKMLRRHSMMPTVDTHSDKDSLDDLEEEVTWPEVGRILDTFFFLAFAGGQAFLTVIFLVPLFTGDTKGGEN